MKIVCIGANSPLGKEITNQLADSYHNYYPLTENDVDITNLKTVRNVISQIKPQLLINTIEYDDVDGCEEDPEQAFLINTIGIRNVSKVSKEYDIGVMFFSTDYVFDGKKRVPYVEDDRTNPQSVYAISKFAAEHIVKITLPKYFIIRTCGLYGNTSSNSNSVDKIINKINKNETIRLVKDQIVTPTYTKDIATKCIELIETEEYGTYHITNTGHCSWYEFGQQIVELMDRDPTALIPIITAELDNPAKRPPYSVLDNKHIRDIGFDDLRPWQDALEAYLTDNGSAALH